MKSLVNVEKIFNKIPLEILKEGEGIVAGSWVAAEVFKQLGIQINPVANDIDFFVNMKPELFGLDLSRQKLNAVGLITAGNNEISTDQYGAMITSFRQDYKVIAAKRVLDSDINVINVEFSEYSSRAYIEPNFIRLIKSFDINAIQVGIDIKLKKMYGTEQFWKFCKTRQLEIVTLYTPAHSLIRYFKKKRELACYGDDEFNSRLVMGTLENFGYRTMNSFGELTRQKALKEIVSLQKYGFNLIENPAKEKQVGTKQEMKKWDWSDSLVQTAVPLMTTLNYKSFSLVHMQAEQATIELMSVFGDGNIIKTEYRNSRYFEYKDELSSVVTSMFHPTESWKVADLVWRGSNKEKEIVRKVFKRSLEKNRAITSVLISKPSFIIGQKNRHEKMVDKLSKISREHYVWIGLLNRTVDSSDEIHLIEQFYNSVKAAYGYDGIGIIENLSDVYTSEILPSKDELKTGDFKRTFNLIEKEMTLFTLKSTNSMLEKRNPVNKHLFEAGQKFFGIKAFDLTSRSELYKEGKTQKHCVAGYYNYVQQGSCKIVSVRSLEKNEPQITFELTPVLTTSLSGKIWQVRQSKLLRNDEPDIEWLKKAIEAVNALLIDNQVFDGRLMTKEDFLNNGFNWREFSFYPDGLREPMPARTFEDYRPVAMPGILELDIEEDEIPF